MYAIRVLTFECGEAVAFGRQIKAIREEQGFDVTIIQSEGRHPSTTITLTLRVEDFDGDSQALRHKIETYVPLPKKKKD